MVGFEKALRAVKVIKDQIQYRSQSLLNLTRGYFKPCSYTKPGRSALDRFSYLVPNGFTYEGGPVWNCTVPGCFHGGNVLM